MKASNTRSWCDCETPLGRLTLTSNQRGLDGLFFPGRAPERDASGHHPERFARALAQLHEYFAGARTRFELELDLSAGTQFQQAVWRQLEAIPYGETVTYAQLAAQLGRSDERARAVGAAVGRTPLPIIVPCHRVIGSDGKLTGYLGGLQRKQGLLELEAAVRRGQRPPTQFGPRQLALI